VILIDANLLVLDLVYPGDPNYPTNAQALAALAGGHEPVGIPTQALLEVAGKLSFGTAAAAIPTLHEVLLVKYNLIPVPGLTAVLEYAGVSVDEVMARVSRKMALGDAVMAAQIEKYEPAATALLTWNAKHFTQKLAVPVLTPADWLASRGGTP
jgi:hypothetical protein